ncbi:MAG: hypothetical protein QF790_07240 [Gammaproteobacteria bacterium]|jgi:hypothetical protein|nr:hypothetical protein [Gammaproteobacteria bacterium]MDP6616939.1 hypothetical protein [Gammaproteobacteria bacterium]MDP6696037.1 hypothetical protein [Gammaproteobacteria bacterium]
MLVRIALVQGVMRMQGPFMFSFFTLVHFTVAVAALGLLTAAPVAAICLFIVEAVTAFDNAATVAGRFLGIGERTEKLNRMRFLLHAICIGWLLPVYSALGRAFGFSASGAFVADVIAWVLAIAITLLGYFYQYRRTGEIMPVNYFGCLRYAQSVGEHTRFPGYEYTEQQLAARGHLPVAAVLTVLAGLLMAALIGWFGSFWTPFIVTLIMLLASTFPQRSWGPLATSCLEVVFSGGLLYSLWLAARVLGT